ncbi:hypothetical protein AGMMS49949_00160 [Alphaproteobacteria bacterium]|nr:hypothetical protein AGMMS49949_00160 [Alphaproteobacteria bacterium]GHS99461.1 hypothetical protein AGMMS50296_7610 [Alphaproteobacteria bacterium]
MVLPFLSTALGLVEFAPRLAKWLSGKNAESAAEQAVHLAKTVTKTATLPEALQALAADEGVAQDFRREVFKMEVEFEVALLEDRQRARERDLDFLRAGHANHRADLMVIAAAAGLVMCLLSLAFYSEVLPGEAVGIISTIAGIFGGCLKDAFAFEFGSSRGSKMKDSTVASALERLHEA